MLCGWLGSCSWDRGVSHGVAWGILAEIAAFAGESARFMLRRSNFPPPISSARALRFVQMGGRQRPFRFAREGAWRCDVSCAAQTKPFAR